MELWKFEQSDLTKKIDAPEAINKSGVYVLNIKEAYLQKSSTSQATALVLSMENGADKVRLSVWFRNKDGEISEWNQTKLNKLMYLCKIKPTDLKITTKKAPGYHGNLVGRDFLEVFAGKSVGIFLEVTPPQENQLYPNYIIRDFFEPKSKKTSDEIVEKLESKAYNYYVEKFSNAKPIKRKTTSLSENETATSAPGDDEFPF